jgi:hypothetical protein
MKQPPSLIIFQLVISDTALFPTQTNLKSANEFLLQFVPSLLKINKQIAFTFENDENPSFV